MNFLERMEQIGFVGERRAVALLCLGFFTSLFSLFGLIAATQLPEWTAFFFSMAACYGIGFFAVAANWFWGRWFATGLGYSGMMTAIMTVFATRDAMPQLVVFGAMHALIWGCLLGKQMEQAYDLQEAFRKRFGLDEKAVVKVRNSVTRAASSLPMLISLALAPREASSLLTLGLLATGALATFGIVKGRSWGVMALGGGAMLAVFASVFPSAPGPLAFSPVIGPMVYSPVPSQMLALAGAALLAAAAAPFFRPVLRYLRSA